MTALVATHGLREDEVLRLMADHVPVAMAIFDRQMRYLAASERWRTDYGLGSAELVGKSHYDVFPEVHEGWRVAHRRALAGETVIAEDDRFERADGTVHWIRWDVRPWRDGDGNVGGIVIFTEDVTARKQAELALRETEQRYETLFAETPVATSFARAADRVRVSANPAFLRMFELGPSEAVGVRSVDQGLIDASNADELNQRARQGPVRGVERTLHTRSGRPIDVLLDFVPVRVGSEDYILTTCRDVSEHREAEALERVLRASSRLVRDDNPDTLLAEIVDAAIAITQADAGNLQIATPGAAALQVVISRGGPPGDLVERATPLVSRTGESLGVIATHYRHGHQPSARGLRFLDLLARQAADFLERTNQKHALQRAEALSSGILMTSPDGIVCCTADHRIVRFNRAAEEIYGYTAAEVLGQPLELLIHQARRDSHREHVAAFLTDSAAAKTMGHRRMRIVGQRKNGEQFPADVSISKVEVGSDVILTAAVRDITGVRRQNARMEFLANESPAVLYVRASTAPFGATFVGENVFEHFGFRPADLLSSPGFWASRIHPDDAEHYAAAMAELGCARNQAVEYRVMKADGTYCWVRDEVAVTSMDDGPAEWLGLLSDITARKALEALETRARTDERLLASLGAALNPLEYEQSLSEMMSAVVHELGDLVALFLVDSHGALERVASGSREPSHAARLAARGELSYVVPAVVVQCFAERRTIVDRVHALVAPLVIGDRCIGVLSLSSENRTYDASAIKLAEEAARRIALFVENARLRDAERRATKLRDEVLGIVAHDLRSPLNAIVLQSTLLDRHGARESAASIRRSTKRLDRMIQDLLDVAKMESGKLAIERGRVAVDGVVTELVQTYAPLALEHEVDLRLDLAANLPEVWADRDRLLQVLENLVGNALKFTLAGGRITIGARRQEHGVLLWVEDTGTGISPESVPHVFDRFWQGRSAAKTGAGLGLAIVKGIVEAFGGRVWVESELDKGSTFYATLPIAEQRPAVQSASPTERPILLAEDDAELRGTLAELLRSHGYNVVAVSDGRGALERLRVTHPQLLIVDLAMPVVDGWGVLAAREREAKLRSLPVIVVSAEHDVADRVAAAGATFVPKPLEFERLLHEVEALTHRDSAH